MKWLADFAQLGPLAVVCLGLLFVVWKQFDRYAKVIENNTKAMTRMADSFDRFKDVLNKQGEVLDKQGVMLTQQNFLFQQLLAREGN
ncbi:MAG: hypothetical protein PVG90_12560 [Bacillota bacterium]|jgi:hypothetical protein